MTEMVIDVKDVRYVYPDGFVALDGVNVRVLEGERVAILGSNGAGKSTLLMLIDGLFKPSKGAVQVLGMPTDDENFHEIRSRIGFVFQDPDDQLFCPTLWDDITFGLLNMGLYDDEVVRRTKDALRIVGLEGYEEKAPHHLSVGEKKKATIAIVLAMKPDVLILDEPTANLDPKSRVGLIRLINRLHEGGEITLVVATHDVDFVPMVADRAYVLDKGKVLAEGYLEDVFSNFKVMEETGLEPPTITRLFKLLNRSIGREVIQSLPLTVEQALYEIRQYLVVRSKIVDP
ncbi:MAG: ATP-binding cassette domain-containing protein [archaeon]|nr:ATP-binding cassette domain-containing protein [archaeon]MCP8305989.1 ATP-binding cassette domain-containing protein [archaeon]